MIGGLWGYVIAAGAAIAAAIGFWLKAKSSGRAEARQQQETVNANAIREGAQARDRVLDAGVDSARGKLRSIATDRPRD